MPRYKATIAYDGTPFCGWQRQANAPSVQETIETVLSNLHKAPSKVIASGRTDAGVHARSQVIHFDSSLVLEEARWLKAFNSQLPKSIKILSLQPVSEEFHARFSANSRLYHYYLKPSSFLMPWQTAYCWGINHPINDLEKLKDMTRNLLGTHDFSSFTSSRDPSPTKIRTILKAQFIPWEEGLCFQIEGSSFLWNQVRSTVGTLLEFERKGRSLEDFRALILEPNRKRAGTTAPPHGLFLENVFYPSIFRLSL